MGVFLFYIGTFSIVFTVGAIVADLILYFTREEK